MPTRTLFLSGAGTVVLPDERLVLVGREDGGNLIVHPPRAVWERSELTTDELTRWSFLVAATGRAMLDALPQLEGGCINYWEAGNWALNDAAEPRGPKRAPDHRSVHTHLLGRSRTATDPSWRWGEAPRFPDFATRHAWAANHERLTADECIAIVARLLMLLSDKYDIATGSPQPCRVCGYPAPRDGHAECGAAT